MINTQQSTNKNSLSAKNSKTSSLRLFFSLLILLATTNYALANSAKICEHYLGADVGFTQSTDATFSKGLYYGEACAFKFNIEATVYDSQAYDFASGDVSDSGRCEFQIYLQTQEWGLRRVFKTPKDAPAPTLKDPVTQIENYEKHVKWFNNRHGHMPASVSYQGGGASTATTGKLFNYLLAGRTSKPDGLYNNDIAVWAEESLPSKTKFYNVSTRFGDDPSDTAIANAIAVFEEAIKNNGWFRDFCHWHTNPIHSNKATLYNFYKAVRKTINAHPEKRIVTVGSGTHAQQAWYRAIADASLKDDGGKLTVSVSYKVPDWMLKKWSYEGFTARPVDCFTIPASVKVDTTGTSLAGKDLTAMDASSIRKLSPNIFIIEAPFNKTTETIDITLAPTTSPRYANESLPIITSITKDAQNWTLTTNIPVKLVIFSLPSGVDLSEIQAKNSANKVKVPLRQNTFTLSHKIPLSIVSDSSLDYYAGVISEQKQSTLKKLF